VGLAEGRVLGDEADKLASSREMTPALFDALFG